MIRLHPRNEDGIALVTTLLALLAIIGLIVATMSYAVGSQPLSRRDQDWNAALEAAQSGIDDYLYHLNVDGNYWQYSATNPPPGGNVAFTGWAPVPGPANEGFFRYTPDISTITVDGAIKLSVSGKVRNSVRTVYVTMRKRDFLDYLYFTDYETKDPASYNTGSPDFDAYTPAQAGTLCNRHYYDSPPRDSQCTDINFISRDVVNGPLHTNDAMLVCGNPTFNGATTTSWNDPANKRYRVNSGCPGSTPVFANAGDPKLAPKLDVPPSNSSIKSWTDPLLGNTGCLYTGPTKITFNSTGTMTVTSPFTKSSNCATGTVPLPSNGVIYVQNVPSVPSDPNYTAGCPVGSGNPLGYPIATDITSYGCRDGDVFVSGTLQGQVTIAAENNINVIWNLTYQGGLSGTDLLGLIANNYVQIYHPVKCTTITGGVCTAGSNLPVNGSSTFTNPTVQAAILSVQHSFRVQNYAFGAALGNLTINGVISQRYRGIVGTFSGCCPVSGYAKNYNYDTRLAYLSPPHFLDPVASAWHVATWAEIDRAY